MQSPAMAADETPEQLRARGDALMIAGDALGSEACYSEAANREAANQATSQEVAAATTPVVVAAATPGVAATKPAVVATPVVLGTPVAAPPTLVGARTSSGSSLSSVDSDAAPIVQRVCVAVGPSVLQGLCFELSDGTRNGYFLKETNTAGDLEEGIAEEGVAAEGAVDRQTSWQPGMATLWEMQFLNETELNNDAMLVSRGGQWYELETTNDRLVKVHGQNTTSGQQLRCANIHFTMRSGRVLHFEGKQQPVADCLVDFEFVPEGHTRFLGVEITETGVVGLRDPEMRSISQFLKDNGDFTAGSPQELRMRRFLHSDRYRVCMAAIAFLNALFIILVLAGVMGTGIVDKEEERNSDLGKMIRDVFLTYFVFEHGMRLYAYRSYIKRLEGPIQMILTVIGLGRLEGFYGTIALIALLLDYIAVLSWDPWIITIGKAVHAGFDMARLLKSKGVF